MTRSFFAETLRGLGVISFTFSTAAGIVGIVGILSTLPGLCPETVSPARCQAAGSKAALIGVYGLTAAAAGSCAFVAGRLVDSEA